MPLRRRAAVRAAQHRRAHPVVARRPARRGAGDAGRTSTPASAVFGFTGRESGLFGLFFELVVGRRRPAVRRRRPADDGPDPKPRPRSRCSARSRRGRPRDLPGLALRPSRRRAARRPGRLAAAWPGRLRPHPRRRACATCWRRRRTSLGRWPGSRTPACHGWAIPTTCGDVDGAVAFVEPAVLGRELHSREAAAGGIPARARRARRADTDRTRSTPRACASPARRSSTA